MGSKYGKGRGAGRHYCPAGRKPVYCQTLPPPPTLLAGARAACSPALAAAALNTAPAGPQTASEPQIFRPAASLSLAGEKDTRMEMASAAFVDPAGLDPGSAFWSAHPVPPLLSNPQPLSLWQFDKAPLLPTLAAAASSSARAARTWLSLAADLAAASSSAVASSSFLSVATCGEGAAQRSAAQRAVSVSWSALHSAWAGLRATASGRAKLAVHPQYTLF